MKRLLLLIPLLVAGCGTKVSEEGEARCLREASYEQSDFVAEKIYEKCRKSIMDKIDEEEKIAKQKKLDEERMAEQKRIEAARIKALDTERDAKIKTQSKEFNKYSDWKFWATRLTFPDLLINPNCVVYQTSKVLRQVHSWTDRYGNRDDSMDSQTCWVPDSVVFNKTAFKYIRIWATYGDIGSNPPGPRGNRLKEGTDKFQFPEYEISAEYVNCNTKDKEVKNIARLTRLKPSDPETIDLGQGDRGEKILSVIDPITSKEIVFAKPLWVVRQNHAKYSVGTVSYSRELKNIVRPACDARSKFWNNKISLASP